MEWHKRGAKWMRKMPHKMLRILGERATKIEISYIHNTRCETVRVLLLRRINRTQWGYAAARRSSEPYNMCYTYMRCLLTRYMCRELQRVNVNPHTVASKHIMLFFLYIKQTEGNVSVERKRFLGHRDIRTHIPHIIIKKGGRALLVFRHMNEPVRVNNLELEP